MRIEIEADYSVEVESIEETVAVAKSSSNVDEISVRIEDAATRLVAMARFAHVYGLDERRYTDVEESIGEVTEQHELPDFIGRARHLAQMIDVASDIQHARDNLREFSVFGNPFPADYEAKRRNWIQEIGEADLLFTEALHLIPPAKAYGLIENKRGALKISELGKSLLRRLTLSDQLPELLEALEFVTDDDATEAVLRSAEERVENWFALLDKARHRQEALFAQLDFYWPAITRALARQEIQFEDWQRQPPEHVRKGREDLPRTGRWIINAFVLIPTAPTVIFAWPQARQTIGVLVLAGVVWTFLRMIRRVGIWFYEQTLFARANSVPTRSQEANKH